MRFNFGEIKKYFNFSNLINKIKFKFFIKKRYAYQERTFKKIDPIEISLTDSFFISIILSIIFYFILKKADVSLYLVIPAFIIFYLGTFVFLIKQYKATQTGRLRTIQGDLKLKSTNPFQKFINNFKAIDWNRIFNIDKYVDAITKRFPYLRHSLAQAGIAEKPETFVRKKLKESFVISFTLSLSLLFFLIKIKGNLFLSLLAFIVFYLGTFLFLISTPKAIASRHAREIDNEITYAGRFLLIELNAGVPLFDAIKNVADNFELIGKHFKEIIKRVDYGKPLEQALNEVTEITPSDNFRKLLFTVVNSLKTGADVSIALESVVEQISREKLIRIKEYGKKLNPIVMFYLIIAVIAPSLGIAVLTLLSSFLGISFSLSSLLGISFGMAILQMVFISVIDSLRRGI